MTERTPDHSPIAHPPVPDSSHLPQDQGGERAPYDFRGISLQEAIDRGLVHDVKLDPETGEPIAVVPNSLGDVREPSKTEQTEHFVPLTPEQTEHKGWSLKKKVVVALAAAAAVLVAAIGVSYGANATNRPAPVATASTDPLPTPDIASPTPSSVETTPAAPKLPFDGERVAIQKDETAAEFYDNNGPKPRIQYALSAMHGEIDGRSPFGHQIVGQKLADPELHKLPNDKLLSDYNAFKEISLTAKSKPQDVLYAYMFGEFYATAHDDSEEGKKILAAVVRDPNSAAYTDLAVQVEEKAGATANRESILNDNYQELRSKREVVDGKTQLTIISQGGIRYVFTFEPIPDLAETNENTEDDGEEVGIWLLESFELVEVIVR